MRFSMISTVSQTRTTSRVALASACDGVSSALSSSALSSATASASAGSGGVPSATILSESTVDQAGQRQAGEQDEAVEQDVRVDDLVGNGGAEKGDRRLQPK